VLQRTGEWNALEARAQAAGVFKPTVNDVANDVKLGAVDAGIVWDSTAKQYPQLEIVRAPVLDAAVEQITIGVLATCRRPAEALRFARYLGARDRGLKEFARQHYEPVEGDAWAERPEIVLFSGAMLRPGIERTLREFEWREGCRITTVYNGCGILTAQMRAGERPDAYFSCDTSFMQMVADLYLPATTVVDNHLMIIVPKGNPQNLRAVPDLARPGLRIGLAHHEKSAMGNITQKMLVAMGMYDAIAQNLKVESPTGDFLVNQLRTGSLDAIIACRSNAKTAEQNLDANPIDHPLAQMSQPYAVGRATQYKQLLNRLLDALVSEQSRQRFDEAGFGWRYSPAP
jgi:ABC-type molybdate transport system substrate-binding protein